MKNLSSVLFTIFVAVLFVSGANARSQFPIDLDTISSSNALEWQIRSIYDWGYLLRSANLVTVEEVNSFDWQILNVMGDKKLFIVHSFLASSDLFSEEEVMNAFGIQNFYDSEWPQTPVAWREMFTRELSPIEIGTICARLTAVLAQKKEVPALVETNEQWLSRRSSQVAQIIWSSDDNDGFGDADLQMSVSNELIVHGEQYVVYYTGNREQKMVAEGNKIKFPLTGRLGWGLVIYRADNIPLQSEEYTGGKFPTEVTVEGTIRYFGTNKKISETALVPHTILPLFEIKKVGEYIFTYSAERDYRISNGGFACFFPADTARPSEIAVAITIDGNTVDYTLIEERGSDWYTFPYPMSVDFSVGPGEGKISLSFPNGETPTVTWLGLYPSEPVDYVFVDMNNPWGGTSSGGGGGGGNTTPLQN